MSRDPAKMEITGVKELRRMCDSIAPRQARNLARSTTQSVAGKVRNEMRKRAPKQENVLRRAIKAVRRRMDGDIAVSDVRIEHGSRAKFDAFYWHMVEFGTVQKAARPFIRPTVDDMESRLPMIYRQEFAKRLEKLLAREAKKQGTKR